MPCKSDAQQARTVQSNCKQLAPSQSLLCCTLPIVPLWLGHVLQEREEGLGSLLLAHLFAATFTTLLGRPRARLAGAWRVNHSHSAFIGGAVRAGTHIPSRLGLCRSWLCFGAMISAMLPVLGQTSTLCAFASTICRVNAQRSNLGAFGSAIVSVSLQSNNLGAFCRAILSVCSPRNSFFALNSAFLWLDRPGERLLRAKLFLGGAGARNQVQSRAEYRCTLLFSSAISQ